jgi:hypothetical protein
MNLEYIKNIPTTYRPRAFSSNGVKSQSKELGGQKHVIRNQWDYFGKGLQVFFPKTFLHANEVLNEFFCNVIKNI